MDKEIGSDSKGYELIELTRLFIIGKRYRVSTILKSCKEYSFTLDLAAFVKLGYITPNTVLIFGYYCEDSLFNMFYDPRQRLELLTPRIEIYKWDDGFAFVVNDWSHIPTKDVLN